MTDVAEVLGHSCNIEHYNGNELASNIAYSFFFFYMMIELFLY